MTHEQRMLGQKPSLKYSIVRGKEFTDQAMKLEVGDVLKNAQYISRIGYHAARLSGVRLQHEGDGDSKNLVSAAYDALYDVTRPSFETLGVDRTLELFTSDRTHATLIALSASMDSYQFSKLTYDYRTKGRFLNVDESGLSVNDDFALTEKMKAKRGGCPFAKTEESPYFTKFSDRIVETYAQAYTEKMPHGWLDRVNNALSAMRR